MMFEKTSPVMAGLLNATVAAAVLMESKPRIVMGQLFMKLAPTVTIKLGTIIESTEGKEPPHKKAPAKNSVNPTCSSPCTTMKILNMNSTMSQLISLAKVLSPLIWVSLKKPRFNAAQ